MSVSTFSADDWVSDANLGALSGAQLQFQLAGEALTGGGRDIFDRVSSGAEQFTDLISEDIRACANYDQENWGTAFFSCLYGDSVVETWKKAVENYNSTIDELESEWGEAVGNNFGVEVSEGEDQRADDVAEWETARSAKAGELTRSAETAHGDLEEVAEIVNRMLEDGPGSEENIEYLVRHGGLGWAPYVIFGYGQPIPVELDAESAEELAEEFAEAIEAGEEIPPLVLQTLTYLNTEAARKLDNGERLTSEELEFLESFYGSLDEQISIPDDAPGPDTGSGVLELSQTLDEHDSLSEEEKEELLGTVADNIMFLSHESLGGNFERLPSSVQAVSMGPNAVGDDMSDMEWGINFIRLGDLLDHASDESEAGLTFSANLTSTTGHALLDGENEDSLLLRGSNLFENSTDYYLDSILETSTRNEDANHALLTGNFESPYYGSGDEPFLESVLEGLFTHDWSHDDISGDPAVTGLTDWISEDAMSDDVEERTRAAEAAVGFIETISSENMHDVLTGIDFVDEDGNSVDNAAFTALNPEIAESMLDVYGAYIESFSGQAGFDEREIDLSWTRDGDAPIWDDDSGTFDIGPGERLVFLEYLLGEENSAEGAVLATEIFREAQLDTMLTTGETDNTGAAVARLNSLLDAAFHNEASYRDLTEEDAEERKENIYSSIAGMGSSVLGDVPVAGLVLSGVFDYAAEELKDDVIQRVQDSAGSSSGGSNTNSAWVSVDTRTHVLEEILERNDGEISWVEAREEGGPVMSNGKEPVEFLVESGVLVEDGSEYTVDSNTNNWNVGSADSDVDQALNFILSDVDVDWVPGGGASALDMSNHFVEKFDAWKADGYGQLKFDKGDIQDELYGRHS